MGKFRAMLRSRPIFARVVFCCSFFVSLTLACVGFTLPPQGVIDGSVLTLVGELLGFATLAMVPDVIASGKKATFQHGDTSVTIEEQQKQDEKE